MADVPAPKAMEGWVLIEPANDQSLLLSLAGEHSQVVKVYLPDGDLVIGVFPQGQTYQDVQALATPDTWPSS